MNDLTYLYQALAKARETVKELERAIEAKAFNRQPAGYTSTSYPNADTNGNPDSSSARETFYRWVEEEGGKYHDR